MRDERYIVGHEDPREMTGRENDKAEGSQGGGGRRGSGGPAGGGDGGDDYLYAKLWK